jgi:hypothetical protein
MTTPAKRAPRAVAKYDHLVPISELGPAILRAIKREPQSADALAQRTGYSIPAVRLRLETLEKERKIHRVRKGARKTGGYCYIWHFGASAENVAPAQENPQYIPTNRRDDLVSALFGFVRREAA